MKLVIDIPEEDYIRLRDEGMFGNVTTFKRAVKEGVPISEPAPCEDVSDINDGNIYECPCGYGWDKSKVVRHHFCPNCGRAVNSTEQEPCDAVSRKEVMNMLHNHAFDYATSTKILALLKTMCGEVDRMPSVTPQYTDAEIQKMQDFEFAEIQKAYELGKAEMQPCEDAISRQAALEAIRKCHCEEWVKADIGAPIEALQSVTPAEKVGRWVYNKNLSTCYSDVYTCSECGERCLESCYERIEKLPDFCPKCHIKMEVEE